MHQFFEMLHLCEKRIDRDLTNEVPSSIHDNDTKMNEWYSWIWLLISRAKRTKPSRICFTVLFYFIWYSTSDERQDQLVLLWSKSNSFIENSALEQRDETIKRYFQLKCQHEGVGVDVVSKVVRCGIRKFCFFKCGKIFEVSLNRLKPVFLNPSINSIIVFLRKIYLNETKWTYTSKHC
jgi:hypothetical protein